MMQEEQDEKRLLRRRASMAIVALIALAASLSSASAQSTDRNNPEPLRVSRIQGGKEAGDLKVYYYTFVAGPGEVSVHLIGSIAGRDSGSLGARIGRIAGIASNDGRANARMATVHIAGVRLFDLNANILFSLQLTTDRTSSGGRPITESVTNPLRVTHRQQLLMEVTLYKGTVRYQVSVEGAVELEHAPLSSREDRRSSSYPPRGDPQERSSGTAGANPGGPGKQKKEADVTTPTEIGEVNTEKRVALVIGNSAYQSKPLNNPLNDARDMAEALRGFGFDVTESENLTKREMEEQIRAFGKKLKTGGVGLFYYSGHGTQVKGTSYLIPVGHNIEKEQDVEYEAVDAGRVISEMGASENQLNIVILDACRDNPFSGSTRSGTRGLAVMTAESGTIIAYSTAPGSVASDGEGRNGLYTQELLANIRKPGLKIEEVLKHVRVAVKEKSNGKQVPWETTALDGDFYFVKQSRNGAPESR